MRRNGAVFAVAVAARAEQQHGAQSHPATHRVYHHTAGKVVELGASARQQPGLDAQLLVPGDTLKQRVDQPDQYGSGNQLRPKLGTLGNPARNNGRNSSRKS